MNQGLPTIELAVRLADEGVPIRAIARATKVHSDELRRHLTDAKLTGRLIDLPRDDWPPGFPRDQRALQLSRLAADDHTHLVVTVRQLFDLSRAEVDLFMSLLQNVAVRHDISLSTTVHIHHLRNHLEPHGIEIVTVWGYGYKLSSEHRRKAMDMILQPAET
jgi:hypothetical protein